VGVGVTIKQGHEATGFDWPFVRAWLRRWLLPALLPLWFVTLSVSSLNHFIAAEGSFAFDLRLYRMAAEAWLAGHDPWAPSLVWSSTQGAMTFAGPPPTLIPFILVAWIPENVFILLFTLASAIAAMWTLRRLGLPMWWMAFPPIVHSLWVGNLNIFVIALLVGGSTVGGALAVAFKAYAGVPLLLGGKWQSLLLAAVAMLVTVPFLPWGYFLANYSDINAALDAQAWGGQPSVLPGVLGVIGPAIALILLGRPRAIWLAVPVLWPSTQLHYNLLALPAMTPFLAAAAAIHIPGMLGLAVMVLALYERLSPRYFARRAARQPLAALPAAVVPAPERPASTGSGASRLAVD
jgi:hypothetical protein